MINESQKWLLDDLLGEEGTCFEAFNNDSAVSNGTKILYLERAIMLSPTVFEEKLGCLGDSLALIRELQRINQLYYNAEIVYYRHKTRPALTHLFGSLGEIDVAAFQAAIETRLDVYCVKLTGNDPDKIALEKTAREQLELTTEPNHGWRAALKALDEAQDEDDEASEARIAEMTLLVNSGQATFEYLLSLPDDILASILDNIVMVEDTHVIPRAPLDRIEERENSLSPEERGPNEYRPSRWRLSRPSTTVNLGVFSFFSEASRRMGEQMSRMQQTISNI